MNLSEGDDDCLQGSWDVRAKAFAEVRIGEAIDIDMSEDSQSRKCAHQTEKRTRVSIHKHSDLVTCPRAVF